MTEPIFDGYFEEETEVEFMGETFLVLGHLQIFAPETETENE